MGSTERVRLAAASMFFAGSLGACTSDLDCSVAAEKAWLRDYMADWYFWAGSAPNPEPDGFATLQDYLQALLFTGDGAVPADRWSSIIDAVNFGDLFDRGQVLGYGLFVNSQSLGYSVFVNSNIELDLPLQARFIEEQSPAATAGLKRGDTIVSINGRPSAELIAANDFAALTPSKAGDTLELVMDDGSGPATYDLVAQTYTLTPVPVATVLPSANGIMVGYLVLSTFITPSNAALIQALASIRSQGATELIVDLRYNGGGLIDTATLLASLIAGAGHAGQVFARFTANAMHHTNDTRTLSAPQAPAFPRVLVLTGPRSCSASELVINGLRPFAEVVTLGGTTCGKPFAFNGDEHCGSVYDVVTSEVVNALGEGQYYDGIAATCPVDDDFNGPLGSPSEKLLAAALSYLDSGGSCPNAE